MIMYSTYYEFYGDMIDKGNIVLIFVHNSNILFVSLL